MNFYRQKVLDQNQLKRLSEHKYSSESLSIFDSFLQPWWNWLVGTIPLWVAPNLITIVGLIINIATTLILVYYSPDAKSEAPGWAFVVCALGLFVYQSLDAIDGKQARRTGTSSPLGELFDHGCDSVSTVFVAISACIATQLGAHPNWMFFQCFCALILFYCAHWQAYVSGTVKFGRVDVTEAQICIIIIHLISAVYGPGIWSTEILGVLEIYHIVIIMVVVCGSIALNSLFLLICHGGVGKNGSTVAITYFEAPWSKGMATVFLSAFFKIFVEFCQIFWTGGVGKNGSTVALGFYLCGLCDGVQLPWMTSLDLTQLQVILATGIAIYLVHRAAGGILQGGIGRNGSSIAGTSVLSPIISLSAVVVPAFVIAAKSESQLYENHPVLYISAFGLVAAKVTNRLVVAHMTRSEMIYWDTSMLGPAMIFMDQYFNCFIPEYIVLWICLVFVCGDLMWYSRQVCSEICAHLGIQLFRIVPGPPSGGSSAAVTAALAAANRNVEDGSGEDCFLLGDEAVSSQDSLDDDEEIIFEATVS